jgi:hypothetical protein
MFLAWKTPCTPTIRKCQDGKGNIQTSAATF